MPHLYRHSVFSENRTISYSASSSCKLSIKKRRSIEPALNKNWWVGIENRGFVISATPGRTKSSIFWLAMMRLESFFRHRLSIPRIYSMAVGLESHT